MKRLDTIYKKAKIVLAKPQIKRRIKWGTVILLLLNILSIPIASYFVSRPGEVKAALPTYVDAGTVGNGTGSLTVALPAGIATNDILLLFIETENEAISVTTAGSCSTWAAVADSPQGTGTASATDAVRLTAFWCRYGGSGTTGPTISDSGDHQLARIIAIRGVIATGDPWDVTSGGIEAGNTDNSGVIPGDITTDTDRFVVTAIATALPDGNGTAGFSSFANTDLTNFLERTDNTVNSGTGGGLGIAAGEKASAGTYGNTTVTTSDLTAKAYMTIALKPAPSTITVTATGTQSASMLIPSTNQYAGGVFTFTRNEGTANVTAITVSETDATLAADTYLGNLDLYYETAGTCTYDGTETLFGTTASFSSEKATVSGTMSVGISQVCVYAVLDVLTGAPSGDTFDIEITNPSTEVTVSAGLVAPASAIAISGSTQINLAPAVKQDHYRWRNDNGKEGDTAQNLYFNPIGNGYGTAEFSIVGGCTAGSEWDCVHDGSGDTQSSAPTSDLETSQLLLAAATDYYTLADSGIPTNATVTQLDITVAGADDIGNPNTSVTLGFCVDIVADAYQCGTSDSMGVVQAINGVDQVKTQQFSSLSLTATRMDAAQLVLTGTGVKAEISTLYVLVTYSTPGATWAQNEDAPHANLAKSNNIRLRFQADNTGGTASNYNYRLEWATRGADNSCDTGFSGETYNAVPDTPTTEHFDMTSDSGGNFADGDPTTAQLSNGESYTFAAGDMVESTSNQSGAITLNQNQYTEMEYVFQANANATDGGVYCFRVTNAGTQLDSTDAVAQLTLVSGGGNSNPDTPTNLGPAGYIDASDWTNDNTPTFNFDITDPDAAEQVKYRIQIDDTSGFVSPVLDYQPSSYGSEGTYNYTVGQAGNYTVGSESMTLSDASGYYWQVKGIDDDSAESAYEEAGVDGTIDFRIDATAPTGGTIYDGNDGTQHDYNDYNSGSLTALSAYWSSSEPVFTVSGKPATNVYQYAVGTTQGGTDIITWTYTGTSGTETYANATGLVLQTGQKYYFSVRAYDAVGNIATLNSSGQQVFPTLSYSLDSNEITFDDLGNANNWTNTKTTTATVSTNAYNGYNIQAYLVDFLKSVIDGTTPISQYTKGSYATPAAWGVNCVDDNTYCGFGYTVNPSTRFSNGTLYAPYSTTPPGQAAVERPGPVNGTTGAISGETRTITHKVSVPPSQMAGKYQAILYLIISANY